MNKIYLIDGSGFIFRAYHALPPLFRKDNTPVSAVFGFCNMLSRLIEKVNNDHILVVFDAARKTFRQDIYPDYKAHRPPPPDDLIPQFSIIKKSCLAFGVPSIEMEGFEADDIIATYAQKALKEKKEVIIVSSDKDLMQLVNDQISLFDPIKNKTIRTEEVIEKFGVTPHKVIDVQSLAGDASDNIPGVGGIGIKTAAQLINEYDSLENLYKNIESIKQPKRKEALIRDQEKAFISKKLVTLKNDVPLSLEIHECILDKNPHERRTEFLLEQGFHSLIERLHHKEKNQNTPQTDNDLPAIQKFTVIEPIVVNSQETLNKLSEQLNQNNIFAFDTETTSLNTFEAELVGISIHVNNQNFYIPLGHIFGNQLKKEIVFETLKPFFKNQHILKIAHNIKYDMAILKKYGFDIISYDDTLLMSYSLFGNKHLHNLDALCLTYLNHKTVSYKELVGEGKQQKTFNQINIEEGAYYACEDAQTTYALWQYFKSLFFNHQQNVLYYRIEKKMAYITFLMEQEGILINQNILKTLDIDFSQQIKNLQEKIYHHVGQSFNIASPKQLGEVLFEQLQLKGAKKTKTGAYQTDHEILENLALEGHIVPKLVQEWRALSKLKSTYIDGLLETINQQTKRIHTSYALTATTTGRFSSSNPNLQNIPIKSENGRKIRQAFIAKPNYTLLSLDYSQIELRLLAHMAGIEVLQKAFKHGEDIHKSTASHIFQTPIQQVTDEQRYKAKTVNFGIIYGISAYGLAKQLHCSNTEASDIIQQYFKTYPGIVDYMEEQKNYARQHGFVRTLFNRHCYTTDILSKNGAKKQFAERQAINAPLQGTCADILKMAMSDTVEYLAINAPDAKLLLTIHDELIFEVPTNQLDITTKNLKNIMENIVSLTVPLSVDTAHGQSWGDL